MNLIRFLLIFLVPGLIGAVAYSIVVCLKTKCNIWVALILDLLIFLAMITGLFCFKHILTFKDLFIEFKCLHFTRNYILLSILISIIYGVAFGFIRRIFFWIKRDCD